jgi:cardiolipin synthase A/B
MAVKPNSQAVTRTISNNQIILLQSGEAYFPALETALDSAMHEIFLESYIFENDHTGRSIAEALRRAALRGVKTHVLIDGFGSRHLPEIMIDYLRTAGVLVLKFRPKISPWTLRRRRLHRLHRKIVVVDLEFAFVGGINVVDDKNYSGQASSQFDYAVRVQGPLVKQIYDSARRLWYRTAWTRRIRFARSRYNNRLDALPQPAGSMRSSFLIRNNFRHRRDIEYAYLLAIGRARCEIILANAYFLPGLNFRHALVAAARRGVRVVLLLQGKGDHPMLNYASHALYGNFLDAGIEIYEYHQSILHAKVAVIDKHWATVGSSNLDPFSLLLALEANIVVEDEEFAKKIKRSLEQAITVGARRISGKRWKTQPIILRLASWFSYSFVRFLIGLTGYAPGKQTDRF